MNKPAVLTFQSFSRKASLLAVSIAACTTLPAMAAVINVDTAAEIQNALKNASPGDEIVIQGGKTYVGDVSNSGDTVAHFYINRSGTSSNPIVLRSSSKSNKATLSGGNFNNAYAFYMENANHWVIKDIKIKTAQKGLIMDGSSNNKIDNVQVYNTGAEAIHFRKNSSNNVLTNCHVFDTGNRAGKEGLGEGIYVGTHNGHETGINDKSNNNRIGGCHIGPDVRAEAFDVKSGTTGTIIEYNYINGKGIIGASGSPAADSYIDLKGDKVIIRNNKMEHKGDGNIYTAIMTYQEHKTSNIYDNEYNVPSGKSFLKLLDGKTHISNNTPLGSGINLVEKDHMNNGNYYDYSLDYSFEKPNLGPYPCFDELSSGCGSATTSTSSSSSSTGSTSSSGSTPPPSGGDITYATWNSNSAETGQQTKQISVSYSNGKVVAGLNSGNNDPYIRFGGSVNVNNYDKVKVRIRNGSTNGKTGFQIFFKKNGSEGGNSKSFTVTANDTWIEKTIDMSGKSNWNGDIQSLRIDGPSYGAGNFRIDTVTLISNDGSSSTSSSSSTTGSTSSGGSSSCLTYAFNSGLKELTLPSGSGGCVDITGGNMNGAEVAIADSDANTSCDLRGTATDNNGGSHVIDGNWELPSLSGTRLNLNVTNNCKYFKLRIR